jgi:hypothetical protein
LVDVTRRYQIAGCCTSSQNSGPLEQIAVYAAI